MREIKFRCYSEQDKIMYQPLALEVIAQLGHNFSDNIKLMQYTGLKDKNNGAEIYEGDICSFVIFDYLDNDTAYTSNAIFQQGSFGFIIKNHQNEECFYELSYILSQDDEVQVLGNIYENPELLN